MKRYALALVLAIVAGLGVVACAQDIAPPAPANSAPYWLDWRELPECQYEDGTGIDQEYPCQWDSRTRGCSAPGAIEREPVCASAKAPDPSNPPVTIYADPSECVTMFDAAPEYIRRDVSCWPVLGGEPVETTTVQ